MNPIEAKAQALVEAALELLEQIQAPKVADIDDAPFCYGFTEFLKTGDISELAPSGKMDPVTFKLTQHYIFCDVIRVNGKTIQATFISNPSRGFTAISPQIEIQTGKCILINSGGVILGYVNNVQDFNNKAHVFNSLAARSKP